MSMPVYDEIGHIMHQAFDINFIRQFRVDNIYGYKNGIDFL